MTPDATRAAPSSRSQGPLAGLRVLEHSTGFAAGVCGRMLARHGAVVTRTPVRLPDQVEPSTRRWLDRSKTVTPAPLHDLFEASDVVITDLHPGTDRGDLDPMRLAAAHGRLIIASITPFGESGPWRNYRADALTLDALSGTLIMRGSPERPPVSEPRYVMELAAGLNAFNGILAALIRRERGLGEGEIVDVSLFESTLHYAEQHWSNYSYQGIVTGRPSGAHGLGMIKCKDGYAMMMLWDDKHWHTFGAMLGDPEFATYSTSQLRAEPAVAGAAREKARPWFESRTKLEAFQEAQEHQLPFGFSATVPDLLNDPQLVQRGTLQPVPWDDTSILMPDVPFVVPPAETSGGRALAAPNDNGPLSGLSVLEFSAYWAGPLAGRLLADLGASVVKVEGPSRPDPVRIQQPKDGYYTRSDKWERGWWNGLNVGKLGLAIDLAHPAGRELFRDVVARCDVFLENFSRRVMTNLGLEWQALRDIQESITLVSMSAFGRDGPYRDYIAFGANLEPTTGVTELVGYADGPPELLGSIICDPIAGLAGAAAALTALYDRYKHDAGGRSIDLSQRDALISAIPWAFAEYQIEGTIPHRDGNQRAGAFIHDCFPCLGQDQFVAISCKTLDEVDALANLLAPGEGLGSQNGSFPLAKLERRLTDWCRTKDKFAAFEKLQAAGITAAPLLDVKELDQHPQLEARGFFRTIRTGAGFENRAMTYGFRFLRQPLAMRYRAARFGEHNEEILKWAGIDTRAISAAAANGVIATEPTAPFPASVRQ